MFRLLGILVAIYSSSNVNGAPLVLVGSGEDNSANENRLNVAMGEGTVKSENALTFPEEKMPLSGVEGGISPITEPSLKPRTLGNSESNDNKTIKWGQKKKKTKRAKVTIKSNTSDRVKEIREKYSSYLGRQTRDNKGAREETTDTAKKEGRGGASSSRPSSSTVRSSSPPKTSPLGPSQGLYESDAIRTKRENALVFVKAAGILLLNPGAEPYDDERLRGIIDNAFFQYYDAFNRPLPNFELSDEKYQLSVKLAAIAQILKDLQASEESKAALGFAAANYQLPMCFLTPSGPGINGVTAKERADRVVSSVRFLLSQPGANPQDKNLARLIDAALREYGQANDGPQVSSMVEDKRYTVDDKLATLKRIQRPKQTSFPYESGLEEFEDLRDVVDAEIAVKAAQRALESAGADPSKDDELVKLIDYAIEKYNLIHKRPKVSLKWMPANDRWKYILEEINSIFKNVETRKTTLDNVVRQSKVANRRCYDAYNS